MSAIGRKQATRNPRNAGSGKDAARLHGVVLDGNGCYVMATLARANGAGWRLVKQRRWDCSMQFRTAILLSCGVTLGLPSRWRPTESELDHGQYVASDGGGVFVPQTHALDLSTHTRSLSGNLLGTVSDDAFLYGLPTALLPDTPQSYIAVCKEPPGYKLGAVANGCLCCVMDIAPGEPEHLPAHCARMKRFVAMRVPGSDLPRHVYLVGDFDFPHDSEFSVHQVPLARGNLGGADAPTLRAAGVALTQLNATAPRYTGPSPASRFRSLRTSLYAASLALVALAFTASAVLFGARKVVGRGIERHEKLYKSILTDNEGIRKLAENNEQIAGKILRLNDTFSQQTRWSTFLSHVGVNRPDGLYLQRFGSEPMKNERARVRCALTGWATDQAAATTFMSGLRRMDGVSDVQLASLRQGDRKATCTFKVRCTLKLQRD